MIRYAYCLATLIFVALVGAKFDRQTGFTSLIRFGETWQEKRHGSLQNLPIATVSKSNGYDGQFYAQIALDPHLRDSELERSIDSPAYRSRRILTPAIAALLGLGHPWWTLQAYALLNVATWLALGWLLWKWIGDGDWRCFARWAGCMFSMGVLDSVRQSLVDLPALFLLSLAIHAHVQPRTSKSTFWLALGNLAKETTLIGTIALNSTGLASNPQRRRALVSVILAAIPLGIWWLYVDHRFSAHPAEGFGNFTWPMLGLFAEAKLCLREIFQGNFDGRYSFGLLAMIGLLIQCFALWRTPDCDSAWWRVGAAYSLLLPFLSLWVWSGYWAACRAVLPLTLGFNLLLPANRAFWPLWIAGNLTLIHAVWRFL
jgi:hypothetical protein